MTDPKTPTTTECYCCTCWEIVTTGLDERGMFILDLVEHWDYACRNHGAHGVRACNVHQMPGFPCGCGCNEQPSLYTNTKACPGAYYDGVMHKTRLEERRQILEEAFRVL